MGIDKVKVSGRLALACGGCGELILFLGRERDWYGPGAEGRPRSFLCGGCGQQLTLANRVVGAGAEALSLTVASETHSAPRKLWPFEFRRILCDFARARMAS